MSIKEYREHLQGKNVPDDVIEKQQAILQDQPISPDVCECSLGHASHYLAGLNLKLKGEVLESAVKGDTRCRFVFYLPNKDNNTGDEL